MKHRLFLLAALVAAFVAPLELARASEGPCDEDSPDLVDEDQQMVSENPVDKQEEIVVGGTTYSRDVYESARGLFYKYRDRFEKQADTHHWTFVFRDMFKDYNAQREQLGLNKQSYHLVRMHLGRIVEDSDFAKVVGLLAYAFSVDLGHKVSFVGRLAQFDLRQVKLVFNPLSTMTVRLQIHPHDKANDCSASAYNGETCMSYTTNEGAQKIAKGLWLKVRDYHDRSGKDESSVSMRTVHSWYKDAAKDAGEKHDAKRPTLKLSHGHVDQATNFGAAIAALKDVAVSNGYILSWRGIGKPDQLSRISRMYITKVENIEQPKQSAPLQGKPKSSQQAPVEPEGQED